MYRIISPSRCGEVTSRTYCNNGRGVSKRRWRSAANRPRRQPRRGWETEKTSQMKQASRVQQKFNSPKISSSPTNHPPQHLLPQKTPPLTPPSQPWSDPGLFWAKPGPIWVRSGLLGVRNGLFGVDSGFSRVKITPFWAPFSPPRSPFRPGRRAKTSPSSPRA